MRTLEIPVNSPVRGPREFFQSLDPAGPCGEPYLIGHVSSSCCERGKKREQRSSYLVVLVRVGVLRVPEGDAERRVDLAALESIADMPHDLRQPLRIGLEARHALTDGGYASSRSGSTPR
jgi:hypothetical protein